MSSPQGHGLLIMSLSQSQLQTARRRALISIFLNIMLTVLKGVAGVMSGSTALIGDAIHSGTDVLGSTAVFVGIWVAGRNHPSFPYGLYKAETMASLVAAGGVLLAAYEIGRQALLGPVRVPDVTLALPVALFCFGVSLAFGLVQLRAGRRLNSPGLMADARDYLADSMSTGIVLVGLVATSRGWPIDRWAAAIVSLFVFRAGVELLKVAIRDLLDASIDRETEREIVSMVENCPRVGRVKKCLSRTAGGRFIVDLDVVMLTPSHMIADQVADRLERDIPAKFPRVVMARVRPHYGHGEIIRRLKPMTAPDGVHTAHLGSAPWFLLEKDDGLTGQVTREYLENPWVEAEKRRGFLVGQWLLGLKPDQLLLPSGSGREGVAIALLREAGVEVKSGLAGEVRPELPMASG